MISPYYPEYYGSSLNCIWQIVAPSGQFIKLVFLDVDLASEDVTDTGLCVSSKFNAVIP